MTERDGTIDIKPVPVDMVLEETSEGPVVVPVEPLPPLTDDILYSAIDETRHWPR